MLEFLSAHVVPYLLPAIVSLIGIYALVRGEMGPLDWLPMPNRRLRGLWARLAATLMLAALPLTLVAEWAEIGWLGFSSQTERMRSITEVDAVEDRAIGMLDKSLAATREATGSMEQLLMQLSEIERQNPLSKEDSEAIANARQTLADMKKTWEQRSKEKASLEEKRDQRRRERTSAWARIDNQTRFQAGMMISMICLIVVCMLFWVAGAPASTAP